MADRIDDEFAEQMYSLLTEEESSKGWKLLHGGGDETKVYSRRVDNTKLKAFKVSTECRCTVDSLIDVLDAHLIERHKEWNETFHYGKVVEKIDDHQNVQYWQFTFDAILTGRDFLVARRRIEKDNGEVLLIEKSIIHKDVPEVKGFIRCDMPYNVRLITPLSDGKVRLLYMNLTDIKGWIPAWVANKNNPTISVKEIDLIKKICEKGTTQ